MSLTPFKYFTSITGDCTSSGSGSISIEFTGGTPPYTLQWVSPILGGDQSVINTPITKTGLTHGTYLVRVNDSTLPVNESFYVNIPVSSGICCSIVSVEGTKCGNDNGSITGTSTSNFSSTDFYLYTVSNQYLSSATTNNSLVIFNELSAGTYYLIGKDLGGCTGKSQSFIIEDSTELDYGLYIVPNNNCDGFDSGKLYITGLTGNAPFTYNWSNGATGSTVTGLSNGNYSVVVIDSFGCQKTLSAIIGTNEPLGLGYFSASTPSCFTNNGALSLTITGGTPPYYYSASTGYADVTYSEEFIINNIYAGNYDFVVTDAGLCKLFVGTTLSSPNGITSVDVTTNNSLCSEIGGEIKFGLVGGTPPYTYSITDSSGNTVTNVNSNNTYVFNGLRSGIYTASVYDANNCGVSEEYTILTQNKFDISLLTTGATCGSNNGIVRVTVSSAATAPYDYYLGSSQSILSTVLSSITFTNVAAGSHVITVTDATGCSQQKPITVSGSGVLQFSLFTNGCGDGNEGSITSFITSGEPPFVFNWSGNVSGNPQSITVTGLTGGSYSLTVTDSNNCSSTRSISVNCNSAYTTYETYTVSNSNLLVDSPSKLGLLEMMNEGFLQLTSGNTNCDLISADYMSIVNVVPSGTQLSNTFYTSTSLDEAPSDDMWIQSITTLIESITGVEDIQFDETLNQMTIITSNLDDQLLTQKINITLKLMYNIICES